MANVPFGRWDDHEVEISNPANAPHMRFALSGGSMRGRRIRDYQANSTNESGAGHNRSISAYG